MSYTFIQDVDPNENQSSQSLLHKLLTETYYALLVKMYASGSLVFNSMK